MDKPAGVDARSLDHGPHLEGAFETLIVEGCPTFLSHGVLPYCIL